MLRNLFSPFYKIGLWLILPWALWMLVENAELLMTVGAVVGAMFFSIYWLARAAGDL